MYPTGYARRFHEGQRDARTIPFVPPHSASGFVEHIQGRVREQDNVAVAERYATRAGTRNADVRTCHNGEGWGLRRGK